MLKDQLVKEIESRGFILVYNLKPKMAKFVRRLRNSGILIGCDQIDNTRGFMNDSYHLTWKDNRYNLIVHQDGRQSWIGKKT